MTLVLLLVLLWREVMSYCEDGTYDDMETIMTDIMTVPSV